MTRGYVWPGDMHGWGHAWSGEHVWPGGHAWPGAYMLGGHVWQRACVAGDMHDGECAWHGHV